MSQSTEVLHFKILIIGESNVGKSSLMNRFVDETFQQSFLPTIGLDFKVRTLMIDDYQCKIQIWDTAGQERFRVITTSYYRDAAGVLIVYDVTNTESFSCVRRWIDDINKQCQDHIAKILVGNKDDFDSTKKVVFTADAKQYARQMNLNFFETSAKDNRNIQEAFYSITRLALQQRLNARKKNPSVDLRNGKVYSEPIQSNRPKKKHRKRCLLI